MHYLKKKRKNPLLWAHVELQANVLMAPIWYAYYLHVHAQTQI